MFGAVLSVISVKSQLLVFCFQMRALKIRGLGMCLSIIKALVKGSEGCQVYTAQSLDSHDGVLEEEFEFYH
jgi:hypothetical protein